MVRKLIGVGVRMSPFSSVSASVSGPVCSMVKHAPLPESLTSADAQFAVFPLSGRQYKVTLDDTIVADHLHDVDIDSTVEVQNVLMVGSASETQVGRPYVPGATVTMRVEELAKDKKVYAYKFRRRKNSQRLRGFRRQVTILRVTDIDTGKGKASDSEDNRENEAQAGDQ